MLTYAYICLHTLTYAYICLHTLAYAYIHILTLTNAYKRLHTLTYAYIRLHMLIYAFKRFHMLLLCLYTLLYAITCFYMHRTKSVTTTRWPRVTRLPALPAEAGKKMYLRKMIKMDVWCWACIGHQIYIFYKITSRKCESLVGKHSAPHTWERLFGPTSLLYLQWMSKSV